MATFTPKQFTEVGLRLMGVKAEQLNEMSNVQQTCCFSIHFGPRPAVCAKIWSDLVVDCRERIEKEKMKPSHFLMGLHFLKCYPTEEELAVKFRMSVITIRRWVWVVTEAIQALKDKKVRCRVLMNCSWSSRHYCHGKLQTHTSPHSSCSPLWK